MLAKGFCAVVDALPHAALPVSVEEKGMSKAELGAE